MKKSQFLALALATMAFMSCGNKTETNTNDADSVSVEDSVSTSIVSSELQPTVDALMENFTSSVTNNDANALTKTLADMQVVYKNLVEQGKLDEAKKFGKTMQSYVNEHSNELKAMAEGNSSITSLVEGVKNLPVSAEATVEEAKQAIIADVVSKASPTIAKGATVLENAKETADAAKNAPEAIKKAAETAAQNTVDNAKAAAQNKVNSAATTAATAVAAQKAKADAQKAKAKAEAAEKVNSAANKANSALDKLKSGINAAAQGATK